MKTQKAPPFGPQAFLVQQVCSGAPKVASLTSSQEWLPGLGPHFENHALSQPSFIKCSSQIHWWVPPHMLRKLSSHPYSCCPIPRSTLPSHVPTSISSLQPAYSGHYSHLNLNSGKVESFRKSLIHPVFINHLRVLILRPEPKPNESQIWTHRPRICISQLPYDPSVRALSLGAGPSFPPWPPLFVVLGVRAWLSPPPLQESSPT